MAQPTRDPSLPPRLLFRMCFALTSRTWSTRVPPKREQLRFSAFTSVPQLFPPRRIPPSSLRQRRTERAGLELTEPSQSGGRAPKKKGGKRFVPQRGRTSGRAATPRPNPSQEAPPLHTHPQRQRSPSQPLPQRRHLTILIRGTAP